MIELTIDKLTFGGRGVGRLDGKAVFVPYVLPGERIHCRIVRDKKRYAEAEPLEIVEASSERIEPPCPLFRDCGGCQWQHIPYQEQTAFKDAIFRDALSRNVDVDETRFLPIVESPSPWHYRSRAQLKCRMTGDGFVTGFYRPGTHFVVDMQNCPLLTPEMNDILPLLKECLAGFSLANKVPQVDLTVCDDRRLSLIVHFLEEDVAGLKECLAPVAEAVDGSIHVQQGRKTGILEIYPGEEQAIRPLGNGELCLGCPPGGFTQVNLGQNRNLVADAMARAGRVHKLVDLYCGIGNFTLPLAANAGSVLGVEDYAPAIEAAKENAARNGINNATFITADASATVSQHLDRDVDLVLLDPPRRGAYEVVKVLARRQVPKILYVSCDPMTLARDLTHLCHNGYRPVSLQAYDMFPQTYHIEGMVVLEYQ